RRRWRTAGCCSWTRHPSSPATHSTCCASRWRPVRFVLARSGMTTRLPARFTLVMTGNSCPCAKVAGPAEGCSCSPAAQRRYLGRLSGPLLDRVDVKIELLPAVRKELLNDRGSAEPAAIVASEGGGRAGPDQAAAGG